MKKFTGIGGMSGTSMDGLDLAYCSFVEKGDLYDFKLEKVGHIPFEDQWLARLSNLIGQSAEVYAKTNVYFGHWLGRSIKDFIEKNQLRPDFVATHGQTIFHQPEKNFTAQIGDGETLVSYLSCPLVSNFRNKDIALGGEGAPLIPIGEKYLFPQLKLFLNLGGFCNVTYNELAFDVGPCNIVLNHLYQLFEPESEYAYDPEGKTARSGSMDQALFEELNSIPYYHQSAPKSLGWEWVVQNILPQLAERPISYPDLLHTFCHHIAFQIGAAVKDLNVQADTMLITGGGRHNEYLMELIASELEKTKVKIDTEYASEIIDYKEAIVFAFLGLRTLTGKTTTLASVTGASSDSVTGSIHLPPSGKFTLFS